MAAELPMSLLVGESAPSISPGMVREMFVQADLQHSLDTVAALASQLFGCQAAVLTSDHGRITCGAATDPAVQRAGELQVQYAEGPSVDAIVGRRHSMVDDLRVESRWRFWAPQAAWLGFRSVVSVSLAEDDVSGVLNLYSNRPGAFRAVDLATAEVFVQHAALALTVVSERTQLREAMSTRTLIGQAQGVLMQRYQMDAERAFTVMRRYSSHSNRKLRHVAEDVVRTRQLPAPPQAPNPS